MWLGSYPVHGQNADNAPWVWFRYSRVFLLLLLLAAPVRAQSHKVPFTLRDGKILIQVKLNGQPVTLKLDSGSTNTVFDAKFLKIPGTTKIQVRTASGPVEASRSDARLEIGDVAFVLPQAVYLPNFASQGLVGSEGVIGLDVLRKFKRVTIDFAKSEIALED